MAQRIADANAAMRQQLLHLSPEAVEQDDTEAKSEEESLEMLFTQLDTTRERLKDVKTKCFGFKSVSQDTMDRMYVSYVLKRMPEHFHSIIWVSGISSSRKKCTTTKI